MIVVLMVASGAAWEPPALELLGGHPGIVVLKRCVDVDDLLAAASAGQAEVAVVGLEAPGLDAAAIADLRRHGVRPVVVVPDTGREAAHARLTRLGVGTMVSEAALAQLPEAVARPDVSAAPHAETVSAASPPGASGRVLAVWGPAGAPGRSTIAVAVAAELARRGRRTMLVDADPYGGSVAQQLGVLDEVSGLLAAARLAVSGQLVEQLASVQRALDRRLCVVTGLPRADRWVEVGAGVLEQLVEAGGLHGDVVVDTGFCLEAGPVPDHGGRPGRNELTLAAVGSADQVLVVGAADPVGLARLARGLAEVDEVLGGRPVRVVVNRMRPSLGWSEKDVAGMVAGFGRVAGVHFLPDDRSAVDRSLVAGCTLVELGDSPLVRAVAGLVDALGG